MELNSDKCVRNDNENIGRETGLRLIKYCTDTETLYHSLYSLVSLLSVSILSLKCIFCLSQLYVTRYLIGINQGVVGIWIGMEFSNPYRMEKMDVSNSWFN